MVYPNISNFIKNGYNRWRHVCQDYLKYVAATVWPALRSFCSRTFLTASSKWRIVTFMHPKCSCPPPNVLSLPIHHLRNKGSEILENLDKPHMQHYNKFNKFEHRCGLSVSRQDLTGDVVYRYMDYKKLQDAFSAMR